MMLALRILLKNLDSTRLLMLGGLRGQRCCRQHIQLRQLVHMRAAIQEEMYHGISGRKTLGK